MNIWEAADDIRTIVSNVKAEYHPHLASASIWVLINDSKCIVDNRLVKTETRKCTKTEKLKTGHDFKIIIRMTAWSILTEGQRRIAIDEALCRCGVRYMPQTKTVNGKEQVVYDDIGRVIYTNEIAIDDEGVPKWKINHLDAEVYFALIQRHSVYNESIENIERALAGQPLIVPGETQQSSIQ